MTNKLFVGKLSYALTDLQLEEHFAQAGKVLSAKVLLIDLQDRERDLVL